MAQWRGLRFGDGGSGVPLHRFFSLYGLVCHVGSSRGGGGCDGALARVRERAGLDPSRLGLAPLSLFIFCGALLVVVIRPRSGSCASKKNIQTTVVRAIVFREEYYSTMH